MARPKTKTPEVNQETKPAAPKPEAKAARYIVVERFYEKGNVSITHEVDEDVSHFDGERLESLVKKGLVELR